MIKIEFKEATRLFEYGSAHFMIFNFFIGIRKTVNNNIEFEANYEDSSHNYIYYNSVKSITPYIPTQDPMLDRSHILSLLNISEQEDKLFQEQYKNV